MAWDVRKGTPGLLIYNLDEDKAVCVQRAAWRHGQRTFRMFGRGPGVTRPPNLHAVVLC